MGLFLTGSAAEDAEELGPGGSVGLEFGEELLA